MKTVKLSLLLLVFLQISAKADVEKLQAVFKEGLYEPLTKEAQCVESYLSWDEDVLVFGKERFSNLNKPEVKFSNVPKNDKLNCDVFWGTKLKNENKITVSYVTKCPAGSKYNYTEENKQTFIQRGDKIIFDASVEIDGKIKGKSHCEYIRKTDTSDKN